MQSAAGWEVIGFQTAQLEPDKSWTLTGLLRGLGGSEAAGAPSGAGLVVLDEALAVMPVSEAERGAALSVIVVPDGARRSDGRARRLSAVYEGRDLRPLSPVHFTIKYEPDSLSLSWIRRTRIGGDHWQGVEVPLGEAFEAYEVTLKDADADVIGTWMCEAPRLDLQRSALPADLTGHAFEVRQVSERYGPGLASVLQM